MGKKKGMDERDVRNLGEASQWTVFIVIIYTLGKIIYYSKFSNVENLDFLIWDIVLFFITAISLIGIIYLKKTYDLPKTFFGKKLLTEQSKAARKDRILKAYLPEALILAVTLTLGSYFFSGYNSIIPWFFEFILCVIILMLFNFAWGELNVKGYNKSLEE